MKQPTSLSHYYQAQMRQFPLYQQWAKIIQSEAHKFFPDDQLVTAACAGCARKKITPIFKKIGFTYQHCNYCDTVFMSPRPTDKMLQNFYKNSRAMKFWKNKMMAPLPAMRQRHQISPIAYWLLSIINNHFANRKIRVVDYKPCFTPIWNIKELENKINHLTLVDPVLLQNKKLVFKNKISVVNNISDLPGQADIITAFGELEREYNPLKTIKQISKKCKKGGLFLLTTNSMSGFEYQVLGENSHRIVPPYRLNLLTIKALSEALRREKFEMIDLSTPGKLDVQITAATIKNNNAMKVNGFFKYLFTHLDEKSLQSFQDFLQLNKLSSHLRVAAKKL